MIIYSEVRQALSMLRYLKYVKTAKGGKRGRAINMILASMQLCSPLVTEMSLIIAISRTGDLSMIIKSFVALGFVITIDDMFANSFPDSITSQSPHITLQIGEDLNTVQKITARVKLAWA